MQNFSVTGINHKYAPLEVREVLAIADESLPIALRALRENHAVEQAMILSTCNRIEIICHASCPAMKDRVCDYLSAYHHVDRSFFEEYVYYHQGIDAVRHIFNVASGLDSMVLGETEILGQLKKAYLASSSEGATGRALNECMHAAFALAKKIHADTEISKGKLSVASVAVTFVKRVFDDLSRKTAMLVGLGETGRLLLTHLREVGIGHMIIVNRTLEHATNVAKTFNADAVPLELLEDYLARADIVISQTSAPTTIVSRAHVENALKRRHGKPMLLIDLAVPRDIQADVEELEGAYLYDIDDLEQVVAEAAEARTQEYERCQKLVDER
ncbi:MAG: glutamyl-tRNA reductase, partial [Planctomycetaceae bacterium]|nr:glutamyl-tRNA reductase [Planctomycetaceae bacterium]